LFFIPVKVADDPETLRIKQNTKNISNVAYHGDLQKKAAMEKQRECTEIVDSRGMKCIQINFFSVGLCVCVFTKTELFFASNSTQYETNLLNFNVNRSKMSDFFNY
jgi:hypothetical protein